MNKDDLTKKTRSELVELLENLDLPEVELPSHERQLKTALLNSGYWKNKKTMSLLKKFAPIGAIAAIALLVVVGTSVFRNPSSVSRNNLLEPQTAYAKDLADKAEAALKKSGGIAAVPNPTTGIVEWKTPEADGNIRDVKGNIIFTTQDGKLVPAPYEVPNTNQSKYRAEELERMAGYPNAIFNDMVKAKNTAYYLITTKGNLKEPSALSQEQINILRGTGVRVLLKPDPQNANVYSAVVEQEKADDIRNLPFVVSVVLPPTKSGAVSDVDLENLNYAFTKESFLASLEEAKQSKDLVYLGDKTQNGKKIKVLRFTDNKGNTTLLGIDENNLPVMRLSYNKDVGGGVMIQQGEIKDGNLSLPSGENIQKGGGVQYGKINPNAPKPMDLEQQIKYWTENLEQPTDFKAIQK